MALDNKTTWKGDAGTKEALSDTENEGQISTVDEAALLRKLDFKLLPGLCVLYLLSFLDRSNGIVFRHGSHLYRWKLMYNSWQRQARGSDYGSENEYINSKLLADTLKANFVSAGNQYLTGLTLYFIGYVLFEVPSRFFKPAILPVAAQATRFVQSNLQES